MHSLFMLIIKLMSLYVGRDGGLKGKELKGK